jgi:hypothetical protein
MASKKHLLDQYILDSNNWHSACGRKLSLKDLTTDMHDVDCKYCIRADAKILADVLLLAGYEVPLAIVKRWRVSTKLQVQDWASKTYLRASDNYVRVPELPKLLIKFKEKHHE